jgi:hypothetical protein
MNLATHPSITALAWYLEDEAKAQATRVPTSSANLELHED